MDIRFGFADTARELIVRCEGTQEELQARIGAALADNSVLELEDDKKRKYIIRTERVVFVEIGATKSHAVGFAGV